MLLILLSRSVCWPRKPCCPGQGHVENQNNSNHFGHISLLHFVKNMQRDVAASLSELANACFSKAALFASQISRVDGQRAKQIYVHPVINFM
eukprot:s3619_g3.t1